MGFFSKESKPYSDLLKAVKSEKVDNVEVILSKMKKEIEAIDAAIVKSGGGGYDYSHRKMPWILDYDAFYAVFNNISESGNPAMRTSATEFLTSFFAGGSFYQEVVQFDPDDKTAHKNKALLVSPADANNPEYVKELIKPDRLLKELLDDFDIEEQAQHISTPH